MYPLGFHLPCSLMAASVLNISYGYTIASEGEDPLVQLIERVLATISEAAVPGAWLVDTIPAR